MLSRIAVLLSFMILSFVSSVYAEELKAEVVDCASIENPAAEIIVKEYSFNPNEIKVAAGSVVKWTNKGKLSHMITSGAPGVDPGKIFGTAFFGVNSSVCVRFINPGTYDYFCRAHGNLMRDGKVVVE